MKGAALMVRHCGEKLSKWNPGRNAQYPVGGLAIEPEAYIRALVTSHPYCLVDNVIRIITM